MLECYDLLGNKAVKTILVLKINFKVNSVNDVIIDNYT